MPTNTLGFSSGHIRQVYISGGLSGTGGETIASGNTYSGVWTDSNIIEDFEGRKKLVVVQNMGTGSGRISYLMAVRSGGPYVAVMSGINVATSAATYSGMRVDLLTEPWPYFKLQHRDGVDGSGTVFEAWVVTVTQ